jgi:hypothetical protein
VTDTAIASQSVITLASVLTAGNTRPTASIALRMILDMTSSYPLSPEQAWAQIE